VNDDDRLEACDPEKPFNPADPPPLASKSPGTKSNPIPVIVDELGDVFITVNVKVLVCELKVHSTVAVEAVFDSTPTMKTVSARAETAKAKIMTETATAVKVDLRKNCI
jgi:hypothetical protein